MSSSDRRLTQILNLLGKFEYAVATGAIIASRSGDLRDRGMAVVELNKARDEVWASRDRLIKYLEVNMGPDPVGIDPHPHL
jgi:hypothetical protein